MGTQSQSGFYCFSTNTQQTWVVSGLPAVSVNYINLRPSRLVLGYMHSAYTRVKSHKTSKNRLQLIGLHPRPHRGSLRRSPRPSKQRALDRINSQHSLDCHLTSSVSPLKNTTIFLITIRQQLTTIPQSLIQHIIRGYFVENCNKYNNRQALLYYTFACCLHEL